MAFWKIYKVNPDGNDSEYRTKEPIAIVNGEKEVVKFLYSLPDVSSLRDVKMSYFQYTVWWTFSKITHRTNGKYIALKYQPTKEELDKLRPKKKYQPLPKKSIGIQVGDIYYASWGYEQTNIDWIVIKSVSPTGKTVTAKMTKSRTGENLGSHDRVFPTKSTYGDEFRLQVRENGSGENMSYSLVGSYPFLDGKVQSSTRMGYFHKYNRGDTVTETNSYYQY